MDATGTMTDPSMMGGIPGSTDPGQGGLTALLTQLLQGGANIGQGGLSLLSQLIPGAQAATPPSGQDGTESGGIPAGGTPTEKLQGQVTPPANGSIPNFGNYGAPLGPNIWAGAPPAAFNPPAMNANPTPTPLGTGAPGGANPPGTVPPEAGGAGAAPSDLGPSGPTQGGVSPPPPANPNNPDLLKLLAAGSAVKAGAAPQPIPSTGVVGGLHPAAAPHPIQPSPVLQQMLQQLLQRHGSTIPNLGMLMPR